MLSLARGVTLLTGENGSGKTSILDAVKVALGADLGSDRTVRGYLLKQSAPVAMVRIVVDNRPEPGTRRRPFDALGEHSQDLVTLAVVFRAADESDYVHEYHILDGDVVPLDPAKKLKPLASRADYRRRLQKVGIGQQYLKLLSMPQGQVASLCKQPGGALFDTLYDVIGGRTTLEAWVERKRELEVELRNLDATKQDVREAEKGLEQVQDRLGRHEAYLQRRAKHDRYVAALPWIRVVSARQDAQRLGAEVAELESSQTGHAARAEAASMEENALNQQLTELAEAASALELSTGTKRAAWTKAVNVEAELRAARAELEKLKRLAAGIPVLDLAILQREDETIRADLSAGEATSRDRVTTMRRVEADLASVKQGILPYPADVEAFRAELRSAGIPHHLLAEVVEIRDGAWRNAIEAWFDRLRFSILVQEPALWPEAARRARAAGYRHGVLAPDVRGTSPADQDGIFAMIDVREPRYRSLVARLLRHVTAGELAAPIAPLQRGEQLAVDGFVLSRVEARAVRVDSHFLGRAALEQQRLLLENELVSLRAAAKSWATESAHLRDRIGQKTAEISAQKTRLQWEACRDEYAANGVALAEAEAAVATLKTEVDAAEQAVKRLGAQEGQVRGLLGAASERRKGAQKDSSSALQKLAELRPQLHAAEAEAGRLAVTTGGERPEGVEAILADGMTARSIEGSIRELADEIGRVDARDRDEFLPRNAKRQEAEVEAVRNRLVSLNESLGATRAAAKEAHSQYEVTTRRVFRRYFAQLRESAQKLDFGVDGQLAQRDDGKFACEVRVRVGEKSAVHYDSEDLSGGQKAALSILMAMTAVSLESDSAGFFLVDEPFSASDVHKVNELGDFLGQTGAQYLVSMPTSSDLERCGDWLNAVWICTKSRGGVDEAGKLRLAPRVKWVEVSKPDAEPS